MEDKDLKGKNAANSSSDDANKSDPRTKEDKVIQEAQKLLASHNAKVIWRCPKRGYWFVNKERAQEYEKKTKYTLEEFKPEMNDDDDK